MRWTHQIRVCRIQKQCRRCHLEAVAEAEAGASAGIEMAEDEDEDSREIGLLHHVQKQDLTKAMAGHQAASVPA